jgi:hypothetical protein
MNARGRAGFVCLSRILEKMDPLSVIMTAIAPAAASGAAKVAQDIAPDAYNYLRELIHKKLGNLSSSQATFEDYQKDPIKHKKQLSDLLVNAGVDKDQDILKYAALMVEQLSAAKRSSSNILNISEVEKVQGLVQQNFGNITQSFN